MKLFNFKKFLKDFKDSYNNQMCQKYNIKNYIINEDGTIDVNGSVNICERNLDSIPLNFNHIKGSFFCKSNNITLLKGCPNHVDGDFTCSSNLLTSLENAPKYVGGYFYCSDNELTSLKGCPDYIGGDFFVGWNKLTTLKGCSKTIIGDINCRYNNISDFEGFPEFHEGDVYFEGNPVFEILRNIPEEKDSLFIQLLNEYEVIRNGRTIIRDRLEEAYYGSGMEMPENIKIKGYEII